MLRLFTFTFFIFNLFTSPLFAQEDTSNPQINEVENVSPSFLEELRKVDEAGDSRFFGEFLYMLFILGILVVLMLFISWFLKRMMKTRLDQVNEISSIKVSEHRSLTQKTAIYLLNINGKEIAIAESVNGVTKLSEFEVTADDTNPPKKAEFEKLLQDKIKDDLKK